MRLVKRLLAAFCTASLGLSATQSFAQAAPDVPDQAWYPEGYLALRQAASEEVDAFPRERRLLLAAGADDPSSKSYELVDCDLDRRIPGDFRGSGKTLALLAFDVAQKRAELALLGYDEEVFDHPLLDYEHAALDAIAADHDQRVGLTQAERQALTEMPAFRYLDLAAALEGRRQQLQPSQPHFTAAGRCSYVDPVLGIPLSLRPVPERGGTPGFRFSLRPKNGEVWLVNAFAFRVCQHRVADPWNHLACAWNEYTDDEGPDRPGRYMFEARWPDGTVTRGAKLLERDMSRYDPRKDDYENETVIVFRRK